MKRATLLLLSLGTALFLTFPVWAQSKGVVLRTVLTVYESPSGKSESLVKLKKGTVVIVLGEKGGWLQIRAKIQKGFVMTGWVDRRAVRWKKAVRPAPSRIPPPAAAPPRPQPLLMAPAAPPPQMVPQPPAAPVIRETEVERRRETAPPDRFRLSPGLGFVMYGYTLSNRGTTPGKQFDYNLAGFGFGADAGFWFWNHMNGKLRIGSDVSYRYSLYNLTSLTVNTGTETLNAKSKSSSHDVFLKVPVEYRFGEGSAFSPRVGLFAGFEWFLFSAHDAAGTAGNINLFVDQTTMSIATGAYGAFFFGEAPRFGVTAGLDALVLNFVSEYPKNVTGTSPGAGIGLVPHLKFSWYFAEQHELALGYRFRMQDSTFKGTASRVATSNIVDGKVENRIHDVGVSYAWRF